jgi:ABC-type uncharacterized transport system permease subunit
LLLSLIAVVCYLIGAVWLGIGAYRGESHASHGGRIGALAVATLGVAMHLAAMLREHRLVPDAALSLADTAAMVGIVIAAIGIVLGMKPRGRGIAAALLALGAILEAGFSTGPRHFAVGRPGWELAFHIAVATTAFALLTIGAVLAVLQVLVDRRLRARRPLGWLKIFTPLESLESGCFQAIVGGFALLTLTLVSGAFFIENLFAQHLVHKVFFAIVAWLVFAVLLLGRFRFGWRGRQALRWTLSGYVLLGLSYFGSKLVLETMLGKHWG